jgi:hypothetical protein
MTLRKLVLPLFLLACISTHAVARNARASGGGTSPDLTAPAAMNMEIIGRNNLGGAGKGGEGLALKQYQDGRRILFLAHESGPACVSLIDVTNPKAPTLMVQTRIVADNVRCNSLSITANILVVAQQTLNPGQKEAGMDVYDVSDPLKMEKLSHFDTSGPNSRGVHFVWFVDGHYAYLATGAKDFKSRLPFDDQFLMIVDLTDPRNPKEVGRWWMPGTKVNDASDVPGRIDSLDAGNRIHSVIVLPERPDRAYVGWHDGGFVILDISDKAHPQLISHRSWQSAGNGFAHTLLPIPSRDIAIQTEEAILELCADWPKRNWVWDIKNETNPYPLAVFPPVANQDALCKAGGRFGAHNINMNKPTSTSRTLNRTVVGSYFAGGVRIVSIADPSHPQEIGYMIPSAPPGNKTKTIQINDVYVDENGLIYANDRLDGGLYIMRYTGKVPLD